MKTKNKLKSVDAVNKIKDLVSPSMTILDIGAGEAQVHANLFRNAGFTVDTVDFFPESTYVGDFNKVSIPKQYGVVWASHCLEHQLNINLFLKKVYDTVQVGGYAAITVPPLKHQIVGGHVNLWNAGILTYNLVLAGFDCSNIKLKHYGYNISAIVQKTDTIIDFSALEFDTKDLITLNQFFPAGIDYGKNCVFEGNIDILNWDN